MEEQRLENYLSIPEHEQMMNEDERTMTYISFSIYHIHTVDPILFCVDTGATYSCIGDKALERIVRHSGRRSISISDSKRDFKFGGTLIRSRGMVEQMLPTRRSILDIPFILDVVDVEIPSF